MADSYRIDDISSIVIRMSINRILSFLLVLVSAALLIPISNGLLSFDLFAFANTKINTIANYQMATVGMTIILLLLLRVLVPKPFGQYFGIGNKSAPIAQVKWAGINPKKGETWKNVGTNLTVVITLVTAVVIYFQFKPIGGVSFEGLSNKLPFILLFALTNSFVEESIFRLGLVVATDGVLSNQKVMILSGALFGGLHYFGTPGGFVGVLVAGYLGWLLSKSVFETKGLFWAWLIHFFQDVIIFTALL